MVLCDAKGFPSVVGMSNVYEGVQLEDLWDGFFTEKYTGDISKPAEILEDELYRDDVSLTISFDKVQEFNDSLATDLVRSPKKVLDAAQSAVTSHPAYEGLSTDPLFIQVSDVPVLEIRKVTHNHLGNLVCVRGIVKQVTDPKPRFVETVFECQRCGTKSRVRQTQNSIQKPHECHGCERQGPFNLLTSPSTYVYHQRIRIQESPEGLRGGKDPRELTVYVEGDLVDSVTPGDEAAVTGVLDHADLFEVNDDNDPLVNLYIDANNITASSNQVKIEQISDEDEEKIKEIASMDNTLEKLSQSIAPSVYGNELEKTAIVLQMLSGVRKPLDDKTVRGDIHVFLVGDPGTGKSQLLQFVNDVMPRSAFTTGENSSQVGLTAAAVRSDLGDGTWSVEGGALVLSDEGIACIDELDKLNEDIDALHTALEQQQVTITKAGLNTTMNARCGLLAAANPKYGRWEKHEPILEQVDIPHALLSRFDLIFLLEDVPDEEFDSELADTVLRVNKVGEKRQRNGSFENSESDYDPPVSGDLLPKYIMYARESVTPVLDDKSFNRLKSFYVSLRNNQSSDAVPVTARKLEALVRLAEASARARLSETISVEDVEKAIDLVRASLEQVGIDPETGELDADAIESGVPQTQRDRIRGIKDIIDELQDDSDDALVSKDELTDRANEELGIDAEKVEHEIGKLKQNGEIYQPETGHLRLT